MSQKINNNNQLMKRASYASVCVAFVLIVLKVIAFVVTGSVAILSSLFDSTQDMMTSVVNAIAIRHATEPADKHHRFGHGKAQALGGLGQAFIIAAASCFLLIESIQRLLNPQPLSQIGLGIIVTIVAILMTIALVWFQSFVIRKTGSLSIKADRAHYTGDILMNVGVILSMLFSYFLDWRYVDSLFGVGVSLYLFYVVYQVVKESFEMLMDAEMPEDFRRKIWEIARVFPDVFDVHDMRTRQSGSCAFIQFCVHMRDDLTLRQAHDILDMIEDRIKERFPDSEVIIHAEPADHRGRS